MIVKETPAQAIGLLSVSALGAIVPVAFTESKSREEVVRKVFLGAMAGATLAGGILLLEGEKRRTKKRKPKP